MNNIIVLCYYYPDKCPIASQRTYKLYISNIIEWVNNVKLYLPTFKIVLYVEIDINEDTYIESTIKDFINNNTTILTIKKFPDVLNDYPQYCTNEINKTYFLLGLKYISIFDYYTSDNIIYRDLDSPITLGDSIYITEFIDNQKNNIYNCHLYLWSDTVYIGCLYGGGCIISSPHKYVEYMSKDVFVEDYFDFVVKNSKEVDETYRSIDL